MAATRKKTKKENSKPAEAGLTTIEMKLLRLALDRGAYEGESDNAAIMFVRKLRERNAKADELFGHGATVVAEPRVSKRRNGGNQKMTFGKYRNEKIRDVPIDYLLWVMYNCTNIETHLKLAIHQFLAEA